MVLPKLGELKRSLREFELFTSLGDILPTSTWLVHFSDHAEKIAKEGFLFGEAQPHKLALTWEPGLKPKSHPGPGFNFAFEALNPTGSGPRWDANLWPIGSIVSDKAILFQASGLQTTHYDGFEQIIFIGADAQLHHAKILEFFEVEEGPAIRVKSPTGETLDEGLDEDSPEQTIQKWCKPHAKT